MLRRGRLLLERRLRGLADDDRGAAAVEFALILPFLLLLYMGSIEASTLFTVDRRIEVISSTMADLVARWNPNQGTITKATVLDYFKASEGIIVPYPTTGLKQVVSFVRVPTTGSATVVWSCSYNGGTALAKNATFAVAPNMKTLVTGGTTTGYLIAAKVEYPHLPVLGMVFTSAITMSSESQFLPRFGTAIAAPTGSTTLSCNS